MRIFLRTFNNKINSKTGAPLPVGSYRGTPEWIQFQEMMISCLNNLGHEIYVQPENPTVSEEPGRFGTTKSIYVHQTKRDVPWGDLFWMQLHQRELFTIDKQGWGADASNNNFKPGVVPNEEAKLYCEALSAKLHAGGTSKIDQPRETDATPPGFILVPVQIPRDYTIKHHSPITVKYFIESIQAWAIENQVQVCFKMHPHNRGDSDLHKVVDDAADSSEFIHKVEGNIHELIRRSMGLYVINSGTGFEGLIHGRPVATFGNCDYNRVTWNADLLRLNEAYAFLSEFKDEWRELAYQFIYWYRTIHAYDVNDPTTPTRLTQYLKEHL